MYVFPHILVCSGSDPAERRKNQDVSIQKSVFSSFFQAVLVRRDGAENNILDFQP